VVLGGVLWGCLVVVGVVYAFGGFWLGVLYGSLVSLCTCVVMVVLVGVSPCCMLIVWVWGWGCQGVLYVVDDVVYES